MAYNLSSEGAEANRNAGYTAPTNYAGPVTPGGVAAARTWQDYAKIYQYDPVSADFQGTPNFIGVDPSGTAHKNVRYAQVVEQMREQILAAAAKRGITQPEFEWMKSTGNAYLLTPELFKESSKEWFNKPYDRESPEAVEFRKVQLDHQKPLFGVYDQASYAKQWGELHKNELTEEDKALARKEHIDFTTPEGVYQLFQNKADAPRRQAEDLRQADLKKTYDLGVAADLEFYKENPSPTGASPDVLNEWRAKRTAHRDEWVKNNGAVMPAPNIAVEAPAPTTVAPSQDSAAQKTFLPPYLQPGAPTDANNITGAKLPVATQIASPTPIAPPITPFTPLMPQGFTTPRPVTPGLFPAMAGVPRAGGFGGGFGATAKLLELPQYLRNFGGINYGR